MDQNEDEECICSQHMIRKGRRHRQLEKGRKGAVSGYWDQDHSHRDVAHVTSQGNGCQSIAPMMNTTGTAALHKVVAQPNPPDSNDNGVQGYDPQEYQAPSDSKVLANQG